jgi:hypothetical protein
MYVKKFLQMGRESDKIDKYALIGIATSTLRKKSVVMYYFLVCVYIFFCHINIYAQCGRFLINFQDVVSENFWNSFFKNISGKIQKHFILVHE